MPMQTPRRRPLTMNLLALSLLACAPFAWADDAVPAPQDTPSAAPQQAQALPEPQMAGQASFVLQGVRFTGVTGATDVPEAELQAAVAGKIGQSVTFSDLEQLAAQASAVYRKHGYALVQVFVPVQEVVDGQVTFNVSEGALGNVSIEVADNAPV
jgi:hemolysin activation/secretion protein